MKGKKNDTSLGFRKELNSYQKKRNRMNKKNDKKKKRMEGVDVRLHSAMPRD